MECLDDTSVHAWVRGTLTVDGEVVRGHLDQCESCRDLVTTVVDSQWIGQSVGRYRIDELIGGGAMGEVFRAHDPDLGRDVAIKLVRAGGSERRLLREAQAMARLAHPNVIRVYDVGTVADKVFLAMELVAGTTLATWFEGDRGWRAVTAIMRDVGRGLAAAHGRGLVHGDVKPENVLIAGDGRVVVTDFGLARTEPDESTPITVEPALGHTATRGLAGTPAYMAPEQLVEGASATPASDQFSYCVTLFEGLYGRRPFAGNDLRELRDALVAGKLVIPARPSVPARVVRVLRRGLATDPQARFPSLAALVGELDRASRRRSLSIAIAVPAVAATLAATAWGMSSHAAPCSDADHQLAGVWDDAVRAKVRGAFDAAHLPYAATSFATVSAELDHHRGQWIDAYTETCTATRVREVQSEALLDIRMQCLRDRRQEVAALVDAFVTGGAPAVRDSVAATSALSPVTDCSDLKSLEEVERMPRDPARRTQIQAVATDLAGCRAQLQTGDYRSSARCAIAAATTATATGYGPTIADAEITAGMAGVRLRTFDQANASFTHALLAAEASRDARARAEALVWLVAVAGERAAFADGHQRVDHAAAVIKGLGDDKRLAADLAHHAGVLLLREGKLDASEKELTRAVALRVQLFGANDARIAEPLGALAAVYTTLKRYDDAQRVIDRALEIQRAALGDRHPAVGKSLHMLAQLQLRMGKSDAALDAQRKSYDILVAAYGEGHRDVALSVGVAAQAYMFAGKYAEALPFAKRSAELTERAAGPDAPDTATALQAYAAALTRANQLPEALAAHQRALAIRMKALGPDHIQTTQSEVSVAMALRTQHRCTDALPLLAAALEARTKQLPANHPDILRVLAAQADCQVDLGKPADAIAPLEKVVAGNDATPRRSADDHVTHALGMFSLARALWDANTTRDRAIALGRDAHAELAAIPDTKRTAELDEWARSRHVKL